MNENRLERALRQGPPLSATFAPRPVVMEDAVLRSRTGLGRIVLVFAIAGLLVVATLAGLVVAGFLDRSSPVSYSVVVERSNNLRGEALRLTHDAYAGSDEPQAITAMPTNATGLRWSPNGQWLSYALLDAPEGFHGTVRTSMFVAGADGNDPVRVATPRDVDQYGPSWFDGIAWSPSSALFAATWNTYSCTGTADCRPPSGIDIFDTTGSLLLTIATPDGLSLIPVWSPDSNQVGWTSGPCRQNRCGADAFHTQSVRGSTPATTIALQPEARVDWSSDNRLRVVAGISEDDEIGRVLSMRPDGSDQQDVAWLQLQSPLWSPDGRWLAAVDYLGDQLTIRNVRTGADTVVRVPVHTGIVSWSPDAERLILFREGPPISDPAFGGALTSGGYEFLVINVDGSGLMSLGIGQDATWRAPRSTDR